MAVKKQISQEVTVGCLVSQTFQYLFKNWKNIALIFGIYFLVIESVFWLVELVFSSSTETSSFVRAVPLMIIEIFCVPFIVENKPFPSFKDRNLESAQTKKSASKAFGWLLLLGLVFFILVALGTFVWDFYRHSPGSSWLLSLLFLSLYGLLLFYLWLKTSFLGAILACGDSSSGKEALKVSWKSVRGIVFPMGIAFIFIFIISYLVNFVVMIVRANIYEVVGSGVMGTGARIFYLMTDALMGAVSVVGPIILLGVAYRLKRKTAQDLLKLS